MNSKNIILIGFMGSGKSSTSNALAKTLKRNVVSTDAEIVRLEKMPIAQIFSEKGEDYFRGIERKFVQSLAQKKNLIIDCGGGVIKDPANVADLKINGVLIYLKTSPEWIHQRTKNNQDRPLLNVADPMTQIRKLLKERESLYANADMSVDTDGKTPTQVAKEIAGLLKNYS